MGKRVLINVITRPNGKRYYTEQYYFNTNYSNDELIDLVVNKSQFSYSCGRKVFHTNEHARKAIEAGKYIIEDAN